MLIVDTGPLVATADDNDPDHLVCRTLLEAEPGPLITTALVVTEAGWLIRRQLDTDAEAAFYASIAAGEITVEELVDTDWARISGRVGEPEKRAVAGTRVAAHDQPAADVVAAPGHVLAGQGRAATTRAPDVAIGPRVAPNTARLAQDIAVSPTAPRALPLNRRVGGSATQNQFVQSRIASLQEQGATAFRVNQQQANVNGVRGLASTVRTFRTRRTASATTRSSTPCSRPGGRGMPRGSRRTTRSASSKGRMGAVQSELFGPLDTEFLNYVRTVSVDFDGSRWQFNATGTEQAFEEVDTYGARRVRDRFTSAMLERYCQALGTEVFEPGFYGPDAVLVESTVPMAPDGLVMTLQQVQDWLEIPGMAESLPGCPSADAAGEGADAALGDEGVDDVEE
ncbi:MAG: type II toxin-antitoxin system VapC family toxin [Nocardioidaceae bacterium]